jgi:hypothetical protein
MHIWTWLRRFVDILFTFYIQYTFHLLTRP